MARKIIWSFEAIEDLKSISDYIARDSEFYASAFVHDIIDAIHSLKEFSEQGRNVPELSNPNIRELFIKNYRLIYKVDELHVFLLGIVHGKRDLGVLWEKEKRKE
jgi:toxin ParE1/3/4